MTTLLIDGDVLCYRACEDRYKRKVANVEELEPVFGHYDRLSIMSDEEDFTDEENERYLLNCLKIFKQDVENLLERHFATEYRIAVGGRDNFRKVIYEPYKMNRHATHVKRNPFVPLLREMVVEEGIAVAAHGMEADDLLRIWSEDMVASGDQFIIVSIDKDLLMIPGMHYRIHKNEIFHSTPEYAQRFYYEQLLTGDATDNIPGVPGIGPVRAKSLLKDCNTEEEFKQSVAQVFYSIVHNWKYALLLTGQLIYLKKSLNDNFTLDDWCFDNLVETDLVKKKKTMEFTIESALSAVDPSSIVTRERWEAAMLYLIDNIKEAHTVVDVLAQRDKIPKEQIEAYSCLKAMCTAYIKPKEVVMVEISKNTPLPAFNPAWGRPK